MRGRRQRGFGLLEVVVSSAILLLVLLTAIRLLEEAGQLLASAQVELAEPSADLATRWLRRDVQGAAGLGQLAFASTSAPLELEGNPEGTLRYERVGDRLERVILTVDGLEVGRRTVLRRLSGWQWRTLDAGVVEVEVTYQRRVRSPLAGPGQPAELETATLRRTFALRGHPRRFW